MNRVVPARAGWRSAGSAWVDRHAPVPIARADRIARIGAVIAIAVGLAMAAGWVSGRFAGQSSIMATEALSLIALGIAAWGMTGGTSAGTRRALVTAGLVGGASGIGSSLVLVANDAGGGREAGASTLVAMILILTAMFTKHARRWQSPGAADAAAVGGLLIPLILLVGYLYKALPVGIVTGWVPFAPRTAAGVFALAVAAFALRPFGPVSSRFASPGPGGVILSRLLPAYCAILLATGWVRLVGQSQGWYGLQVGVAGHVLVTMILFASATGWTAVVIDSAATLREAAERALAASERRYHAIVDATFDGIVTSENGLIRDASEGFAAMFGYAPGSFAMRPITDFIAEESRAEVIARLDAGGEGVYEFVGCRRDGTRIAVEAVARIQVIDGRPLRVSALRDVTARRRLDKQTRQAQKMEAVGRLAGGVAHDFNNLLTVITGHAEFVLSDLRAAGRPTEDVGQILDAAESASGLTRQLLAFSRQQVSEPRVLSLNAAVGDAQKLLARLLGEDITITVALAPALRPIKVDPTHLQQVIMNLAVNARDAMPRGGTLIIETANVEVEDDEGPGSSYTQDMPVVMGGSYSMLTVSDTGMGMDAETRQRVFEPFFTTKEMGAGTGLGLATVYGIVKQSGGYIWVYSEPGLGTTFKVYFPTTGDAPGPEPIRRISGSASGNETVLLVEDSAPVRRIGVAALQRCGYVVLEAPDGYAALQRAAEHDGQLHLLVCDVVMPGMSGPVVAERLLAVRPGLKVLFVSGYTNDALVQHGIGAAGFSLLQKPFTPETITRKVREVLDG